MKWLQWLGSLAFAVFLMSSLGVILTVSTVLESIHGTPFAQKFFYRAGWFDFFLGLVAVNILCSALSRFPFKKHHVGFVITHVGILTLLAGALLSRLAGTEGQITLFEGERKNRMSKAGYELVLRGTRGHETRIVDLKPYAGGLSQPVTLPGEGAKLLIHRVLENVREETQIHDGPAAEAPNHAIRFTLESERAGLRQTFWLVEKNPENPHADEISLGPALIRLRKKQSLETSAAVKPDSAGLRITDKKSGKEFWIGIPPTTGNNIPLGDGGLTVSNLRYYPDARVEKNELVSVSGEPLNPAVQFEIFDTGGQREKHTLFTFFPEFESLHGLGAHKRFDLEIQFSEPSSPSGPATSFRPTLTFYYGEKWSYQSLSSRGQTQGEISAQGIYPAGWMDFSFRVEKLLGRAVISKRINAEAGDENKEAVGVEISLADDRQPARTRWVFPEKPVEFTGRSGSLLVAVATKTARLPFRLGLKDFRKVDYPGTQNPASYESDVVLRDDKENLTIEKSIKMNKPLDYKGYRIFQSSYIQDPRLGEASVFTVAKNPGIPFIYSGAATILTGVILLFYFHPFFKRDP